MDACHMQQQSPIHARARFQLVYVYALQFRVPSCDAAACVLEHSGPESG